MFSKVAILATATLALSVAAAPSGNESKCNTGTTHCCNSLQQSQSASGAKVLETLLGAAAQGITGQFGVNCSPLTVVGAGSGASCSAQPVCCEGNRMNGLVVVGCTPINIST